MYFREDKSIYDISDSSFELIVTDYELSDEKLSLTLDSKEELIGTYYVKEGEYKYLSNNIKYGIKVNILGELELPSSNTVPNAFNYKKYLNNKDIFYIVKIDKIEVIDSNVSFIYYLKNLINDRINKIDTSGYMKAFILGNKDDIDSDVYAKYQKIGVTHLFALSGMHVGLLSGIMLKLFKKISVTKKYILVDILLVIYGFIVGFPSSIKRCILFFLINSINKIFKLEISSLKVMLLVVFFLVFNNYKIIYDVGFIYSVVTVIGIILCSDFISCDNKLLSSLRLSLVAFIFSLPISLSSFYEANLLSVIYNIVYVPYVSIIVYPLSLLSFIIPGLVNIFSFFINTMEVVSSYLSDIKLFSIFMDFNMVEIVVYYVVVLFMFYKNEYRLSISLVLIAVIDLLIPYLDSSSYVYLFDVGQGDSSLIISHFRREVILIDTGGIRNYDVSSGYISFLKSMGIKTIDWLVISHGDYDHMGEAVNLVNNFTVKKVVFNCGEFNELEKDLIKVLDKKKIPYYSCIKELYVDNQKLYFLNNKDYGNENDNSSVIYTELNNHKFLFMGDAGVEVEEDLIEKYNLNDIDVLKVGHHGSKTSSSKEFINKIEPKSSIISVGKNNRYGHPNKEVLNNLSDSIIYRTDKNGSIMFKIKNNKLKVETCSS